jgi:hypothetical protein
MPTEFKILAGVLALAVSYDLGRLSLKKRLNTTIGVAADMLTTQMMTTQEIHSELSYLVHVLNERGITLDEFDLIALPHVNEIEIKK